MTEEVEKILGILTDYYGEERVDLQNNNCILIYWPEVTVTNENDRSVIIKELYAKIAVSNSGLLDGTFTLNRTEYTCTEWYNDYMHSHVSGIDKNNLRFQSSCLGTGPIRDTCSHLNTVFNEDMWMMFALELDKYVHNESVSGVPYRYLEKMDRLPETGYREVAVSLDGLSPNSYNYVEDYDSYKPFIDSFTSYLMSHNPFTFSFTKVYEIRDSRYNVIVRLSNMFIEWFNTKLFVGSDSKKEFLTWMYDKGLLLRCKAFGGRITELVKGYQDFSGYRLFNGMDMFMFKGDMKHLMITDIPDSDLYERNLDSDPSVSTLLNPNLVLFIINKILNIVNYEYGKSRTEFEKDIAIGKKTFYLSTCNF